MTWDIERIAIHEAGHAVVAIAQNRRIKVASIEAQESSIGRVVLHELQSLINDISEEGSSSGGPKRNRLERETTIALAGAGAESLCFGNVAEGSEDDLRKAIRMMQVCCASQDECNAYLGWLSERARSLLSLHWGAVLAIARELAKHRKVGRPRLVVLFKEHGYRHLEESR